jgi:hypothetical protein
VSLEKWLSSIYKRIEVIFHLPQICGWLPFKKKMRFSSICKKIELFFHLHKNLGFLPFRIYQKMKVVFQEEGEFAGTGGWWWVGRWGENKGNSVQLKLELAIQLNKFSTLTHFSKLISTTNYQLNPVSPSCSKKSKLKSIAYRLVKYNFMSEH